LMAAYGRRLLSLRAHKWRGARAQQLEQVVRGHLLGGEPVEDGALSPAPGARARIEQREPARSSTGETTKYARRRI